MSFIRSIWAHDEDKNVLNVKSNIKLSNKSEIQFRKWPEHHVEVVDLVEAEDVEVEIDGERFGGSSSGQSVDRLRGQSAFVVGLNQKFNSY